MIGEYRLIVDTILGSYLLQRQISKDVWETTVQYKSSEFTDAVRALGTELKKFHLDHLHAQKFAIEQDIRELSARPVELFVLNAQNYKFVNPIVTKEEGK